MSRKKVKSVGYPDTLYIPLQTELFLTGNVNEIESCK